MATARRIAANRANARRSTGPRTAGGKRRSAANATRHGLTSAPPQAEILLWFRIILDDAAAMPDPLETDPLRRAALTLARAEAQLARVRLAEAEAWRKEVTPAGPADPAGIAPWIGPHCPAHASAPESAAPRGPELDCWAVHEAAATRTYERLVPIAARMRETTWRTLRRYRSEAEAKRQKALTAWIAALETRASSTAPAAPDAAPERRRPAART